MPRDEKVIDKVLCYRTFHTREYRPYPREYLTFRITELEKKVSELENMLDAVLSEGDRNDG